MSALIVHGHRYDLTLQVVKLTGCAGNDVTIQHGLTVDGAQCNELESLLATLHLLGLNSPSHLQVGGQDSLGNGRVEDGVDGSGIASADITQNGRACATTSQSLKTGQLSQRLFAGLSGSGLGSSLSSTVGGCGSSSGSSGVGSSGGSRLVGLGLVTELTQSANDITQRVGLVKFQVGSALQQFANALGLFHTRQLEQDAASALQLLDIG